MDKQTEQGASNIIDFNAARDRTLLAWIEAMTANSKAQQHEMQLEDWLDALDANVTFTLDDTDDAPLPANVISLADYRSKNKTELATAASSE